MRTMDEKEQAADFVRRTKRYHRQSFDVHGSGLPQEEAEQTKPQMRRQMTDEDRRSDFLEQVKRARERMGWR